MKRILILSALVLLLFSCHNEYELEDKMCVCYREAFSKQGQDFDELVNTIEQHYIDLGLLQSAEGSAYYKNVEILANSKGSQSALTSLVGIEEEMRLLTELRRSSKCDFPEFKGYENSRIVRMQEAAVVALENLNLNESFWSIHLDVLNEADYSHIFYKADYFIVDYGMFQMPFFDNILPLKLDVPEPESAPNEERNVFRIDVDAQDIIYVNGKKTLIEDLEVEVLNFYQANINGKNLDKSVPLYRKVDSLICNEEIGKIQKLLMADSLDRFLQGELHKWESKQELLQCSDEGYYMEMNPRALIRLTNKAGTSYGLYIEIQNILKKVVNKLRVEKCQEMGWPDYFELDDMDEEDRYYIKMLRILVPERIVESAIER